MKAEFAFTWKGFIFTIKHLAEDLHSNSGRRPANIQATFCSAQIINLDTEDKYPLSSVFGYSFLDLPLLPLHCRCRAFNSSDTNTKEYTLSQTYTFSLTFL